MQSMVSG